MNKPKWKLSLCSSSGAGCIECGAWAWIWWTCLNIIASDESNKVFFCFICSPRNLFSLCCHYRRAQRDTSVFFAGEFLSPLVTVAVGPPRRRGKLTPPVARMVVTRKTHIKAWIDQTNFLLLSAAPTVYHRHCSRLAVCHCNIFGPQVVAAPAPAAVYTRRARFSSTKSLRHGSHHSEPVNIPAHRHTELAQWSTHHPKPNLFLLFLFSW